MLHCINLPLSTYNILTDRQAGLSLQFLGRHIPCLKQGDQQVPYLHCEWFALDQPLAIEDLQVGLFFIR